MSHNAYLRFVWREALTRARRARLHGDTRTARRYTLMAHKAHKELRAM